MPIPAVRFSENVEYGFAVGRVRALEPTLLDRNRYDRLIHSRDQAEFLQLLGDTYYGRFLEGEAVEFEAALAAAAAENLAFLTGHARDEWLVELFRLPAQAQAVKSLLKQQLTGAGAAAGTTVPAVFRPAAVAAQQDYQANQDPARVDLIIDRRLHELLFATAAPSPFLTGYLALHADLENLRTLIRIRAAGGGARELEPALLVGGTLAGELLVRLAGEPVANLPQLLGRTMFRRYLEESINWLEEQRSWLRLERLGRELELGYLRRSRYCVFGHEPLVTYFWLREHEQRNLRGLYGAKLTNLSPALAQELVAWVE